MKLHGPIKVVNEDKPKKVEAPAIPPIETAKKTSVKTKDKE